MSNGWIKIHRSIIEWEWYPDPVVRSVFIHLLLQAAHEPRRWKGIVINRGEVVTSRTILAEELGFSESQIRTALSKLQITGEITSKATNKYRLVKLNNYDEYQPNHRQDDRQITGKPPAKSPANHRQLSQQDSRQNKNENSKKSPTKSPATTHENNRPLSHKQEIKEIKNNNKLSNDNSAALPQKVQYGDKQINAMLDALKRTIGIDAFVDSRIERMMARHCLNLMQKIGKDEFKYRLQYLLNDEFTAKNCNKIKFIYNNIKGFIKPLHSNNHHYVA